MQLVHTRMRLGAPLTSALTAWRLGFQRRRVMLCACEMLLPNCGPLPQTSHTCAMVLLQNPDSQWVSVPPDGDSKGRLSNRAALTLPNLQYIQSLPISQLPFR